MMGEVLRRRRVVVLYSERKSCLRLWDIMVFSNGNLGGS
jgi:hypothetical protein